MVLERTREYQCFSTRWSALEQRHISVCAQMQYQLVNVVLWVSRVEKAQVRLLTHIMLENFILPYSDPERCADTYRSIINSTSLLDHDQSLPQDGLPDIEIYGYICSS